MANRIVILEGPDGTGKTTLANELATKHNFKVFHTGVPDPASDLLNTYGLDLWNASKLNQDVVFDRLHVGEAIYGPLIRKVDKLGGRGLTLMQRLVTGVGAQLVFCQPPFDVAEANWAARHEEYVKYREQYADIYAAYQKVSQLALFAGSMVWNYKVIALEFAAQTLVAFPSAQIPLDTIGSQSPEFLIVGDTANQKRLDVPFFALDGSSEFLNDSLSRAEYKEHEIALTNAYTITHQKRYLAEVMKFLHYPAVIALGGKASEAVKSQDIPVWRQLYHPAYWKRFHANQQGDYVAKLTEARVSRFKTMNTVLQ